MTKRCPLRRLFRNPTPEPTQTFAQKSWSYREFDVKRGTPEEAVWLEWFHAHQLPAAQIPFQGWAARDIRRNTVSVMVFDWDPDEEFEKFEDGNRTTFHADRHDDGELSESRQPRYAVLTVQLESKPLPFPEEASNV